MTKRIMSLVAAIMTAAIFFCACDNDKETFHPVKQNNSDSNQGTPGQIEEPTHHIESIYITYYDITHKYNNANHETLEQCDTTITYTRNQYHWHGDTLISIDRYRNDILQYTTTFSWQGNHRIMRQSNNDAGNYTIFVMNGERLDSIIGYDGGEINRTFCFNYAAGQQDAYSIEVSTFGTSPSTKIYNVTFENGDLMELSHESGNYRETTTYTYDNSINPTRFVNTDLVAENLSLHNASSRTRVIGGDNPQIDNYNYTYSNGIPVTMTNVRESVVGKYINYYKWEYRYVYSD